MHPETQSRDFPKHQLATGYKTPQDLPFKMCVCKMAPASSTLEDRRSTRISHRAIQTGHLGVVLRICAPQMRAVKPASTIITTRRRCWQVRAPTYRRSVESCHEPVSATIRRFAPPDGVQLACGVRSHSLMLVGRSVRPMPVKGRHLGTVVHSERRD